MKILCTFYALVLWSVCAQSAFLSEIEKINAPQTQRFCDALRNVRSLLEAEGVQQAPVLKRSQAHLKVAFSSPYIADGDRDLVFVLGLINNISTATLAARRAEDLMVQANSSHLYARVQNGGLLRQGISDLYQSVDPLGLLQDCVAGGLGGFIARTECAENKRAILCSVFHALKQEMRDLDQKHASLFNGVTAEFVLYVLQAYYSVLQQDWQSAEYHPLPAVRQSLHHEMEQVNKLGCFWGWSQELPPIKSDSGATKNIMPTVPQSELFDALRIFIGMHELVNKTRCMDVIEEYNLRVRDLESAFPQLQIAESLPEDIVRVIIKTHSVGIGDHQCMRSFLAVSSCLSMVSQYPMFNGLQQTLGTHFHRLLNELQLDADLLCSVHDPEAKGLRFIVNMLNHYRSGFCYAVQQAPSFFSFCKKLQIFQASDPELRMQWEGIVGRLSE